MNRKLLWEIKKELTRPITERDLKREERRSLFLLGMLAVIVTLRISSTSGDKFTILGIDYSLIPVLNILIYAWIAYAALMLVFISDDMSKMDRTTTTCTLDRSRRGFRDASDSVVGYGVYTYDIHNTRLALRICHRPSIRNAGHILVHWSFQASFQSDPFSPP